MRFIGDETMRAAYEEPVALVLEYDEYDVITTSGEDDSDDSGSSGSSDWTGEWDTEF